MGGGFLRSGGWRAHQLILHLSRPSLSDALTNHSPARAYVRTHLLSSKFKESSSHFSPVSPSLFVSSSSSPSASAFASAAASFARNAFVNWYLGMIKARPVLTKSLTSGAIFVAADVSSQVRVYCYAPIFSFFAIKIPTCFVFFLGNSAGFGVWMCVETKGCLLSSKAALNLKLLITLLHSNIR